MFSFPFGSFYPILLLFTTFYTILWILECIWHGCMHFGGAFRKTVFYFLSQLQNNLEKNTFITNYLTLNPSLPPFIAFTQTKSLPCWFQMFYSLLLFVFVLPFEVITKFNLEIHFLLPYTFIRVKMRLKMLFNHLPFRASHQKILT